MDEYSLNLWGDFAREITDPTLFEIGEEVEKDNLFDLFQGAWETETAS